MTDSSPNPPYEERQIRCPKLGGLVSFEYCRVERQPLPCQRALVCWGFCFDVESFFRDLLTPDEFEKCFRQPPPSKVATLIELIERARKLTDKEDEK